MSLSSRRFLRDNSLAVSAMLIVLLCAILVAFSFLTRTSYTSFVLAQDKPLESPDINAL